MKIHHIALYTEDLERLKAFYEKYFNAVSNNLYHNPKTGLKTYFLSFEDGSKLEIMSRPEIETEEKTLLHNGYIHIAFNVSSKEKVDELTELLRNDGYKVISNPRTTGDGYYESCILDPDSNQVEIIG